ncbi:hypothetical protein JXA27_06920 [Aerococcaceae bacterium zg-B36]|uniref:hypothetical protein n=1 Tax=Aerococcaceae bacterium zg-252 TaxID=2796928 RepID=UPI001BD8BBA3|nr:hypothetical protein [Aerococcaceae bacterium zg-B36]
MTNTLDLSEIATRLESDIRDIILGQVREICIETLQKFVQAGVGNGSVYQSTGGFYNAIDVVDLNVGSAKASFRLTIVPGNISPLIPAEEGAPMNPSARWGSHVKFSGKAFNTEALVRLVDEGGGTPYYHFSPRNFFGKTEAELDTLIVSEMRSALAARGWIVT